MNKQLLLLRTIVKNKNLSQKDLGKKLRQHQTSISKKLKGKVPFQPSDFRGIEEISDGLVTGKMLRPDLAKFFGE